MVPTADEHSAKWLWLAEARALTVKRLGSTQLAESKLRAWLAGAELPWNCSEWTPPRERKAEASMFAPIPPPAGRFLAPITLTDLRRGGSQFWGAVLESGIDWDDNSARAGGAHAWGIKVSRGVLLKLLPGGPAQKTRQQQPQQERARQALRRLYPKGVPDDVSDTRLEAQVAHDLEHEAKRTGIVRSPPSYRTIQRVRTKL